MLKLLHLDASPRGDFSISRQLSAAAVAAWKDKHPGGKVVERDLTKTEMTFVDLDWIIGAFSTPDQLTDNHKSALAVSDTLIAELLEADEIVSALQCTTSPCPPSLRRGSPTSYEFGKTFNYLATGPEGLAEGRKAFVARHLDCLLINQFINLREISQMSTITASDAAKAVVRRNSEEVQGAGNFAVFEELFANDFVDHTPQPNTTPDKEGVRKLYGYLRVAFPDFHPEIHWQLADGECVTTYKTYHGTHEGSFLGIAPTHRKIHFETVDVMRVRNGKITDHWGVGNLLSLMQQIGGWTPAAEA